MVLSVPDVTMDVHSLNLLTIILVIRATSFGEHLTIALPSQHNITLAMVLYWYSDSTFRISFRVMVFVME